MFTEKFPLFILDSLRSAFNVGSIFRTAEAISPCGVILCGITARPGGRKVGRTSRGTHSMVPWRWFEDSLSAVKLASENRMIVSVENHPDAVPLHLAGFPRNSAFILGNEAEGVSEGVLKMSDMKVVVPQSGERTSINVSSTAAVIAWEIQRRRLADPT